MGFASCVGLSQNQLFMADKGGKNLLSFTTLTSCLSIRISYFGLLHPLKTVAKQKKKKRLEAIL